MNFEEMPIKEPTNDEQENSSVVERTVNNNEDNIKNTVSKMQELFIKSAEQYLDKESDKYLKEQIIKFYSDENRLKTELTNVFGEMSSDDISKKIKDVSKSIENKDDFIKYIETKNFATSAEERTIEEERIRNVYESRDNKQLEDVRSEIAKNNEKLNSIENKEEYISTFQKLKEILDKEVVSQELKDVILDSDVLGAIAGIKPASYIQPQMEKRFLGIIKERNGLSSQDLKQFQEILKNFNIDFKIKDGADNNENRKKLKKYKKETGRELIHIYNNEKVLSVIESSNLFSEEEIELAKKDLGYFISDYLSSINVGTDQEKVLRVGALYGYEIMDVKDEITTYIILKKYERDGLSEKNILNALNTNNLSILSRIEQTDLKMLEKRRNTRGVRIKGIKGAICWKSYNFDSLVVKNKINQMQETLDIAKEVLKD